MYTLKFSSTLLDDKVVSLKINGKKRVKNEIDKHPDKDINYQKLKNYEQWLIKVGEKTSLNAGENFATNLIEILSEIW